MCWSAIGFVGSILYYPRSITRASSNKYLDNFWKYFGSRWFLFFTASVSICLQRSSCPLHRRQTFAMKSSTKKNRSIMLFVDFFFSRIRMQLIGTSTNDSSTQVCVFPRLTDQAYRWGCIGRIQCVFHWSTRAVVTLFLSFSRSCCARSA